MRLSAVALLPVIVLYISCLHFVAVLVFTRGFLLTRSALPNINTCSPISADKVDPACSLPATHSKAIIIVIDALRADFVLPVPSSRASPFYHNHLVLPSLLHARDPSRSFLSHFIADAPTTTLQRLKGLTTGSLPTFIDAGSNFAGERVEEDNWLWQAKRTAGKRIAFVGDDTWLSVFPSNSADSVWQANETTPMDSFNVEDLDTVDAAVKSKTRDLLRRPSDWDILIAHGLGLDHAGHRYGAAHPETTRKLKETDELLRFVVDNMPEDALLVLMGDHGMTDRGDHGGDSRKEVDAALWIYSKGPVLTDHDRWSRHPTSDPRHPMHSLFTKSKGTSDEMLVDWSNDAGAAQERSVAQVDLVPTLSLLLGLPIPFGSLGVPIPELFFHKAALPLPHSAASKRPGRWGKTSQVEALEPIETVLHAHLLAASQISNYLDVYASSSAGRDIKAFLSELHFTLALAQSTYKGVHAPGADKHALQKQALERFWAYGRLARSRARKVWARFDPVLMIAGIAIWLASIVVALSLLSSAVLPRQVVRRGAQGAAVGLALGVALSVTGRFRNIAGHSLLHVAAIACLSSGAAALTLLRFGSVRSVTLRKAGAVLPVLLHCAMFGSNSFTVFEDRNVSVLLSACFVLTAIKSLSAPDKRLRNRVFALSLFCLVCTRLMTYSTICREEQMPNCTATFFKTSGSTSTLYLALLSSCVAFLLPSALRYLMSISKSDQAMAPVFLGVILRSLLVCGALHWIADWALGSSLATDDTKSVVLQASKTGLARVVLVGSTLVATLIWRFLPPCIRVERTVANGSDSQPRTQVVLIGYANAFGSSYLLFVTSIFALLFLVNSPAGQVVLVAQFLMLLAMLEMFDSQRDIEALGKAFTSNEALQSFLKSDGTTPSSGAPTRPTTLQLSMLSLLAQSSFFATGHQAVLSSIQWSTAFIGFPTVVYPFSPLMVILNTLSAHILSAVCVPLFVLWNVSPRLAHEAPVPLMRPLVRAVITYSTIEATKSLAAAATAAHLRRHLMVWKIFAPRFMLGAITILSVDVALLVLASAWASYHSIKKVQTMLGTQVI